MQLALLRKHSGMHTHQHIVSISTLVHATYVSLYLKLFNGKLIGFEK